MISVSRSLCCNERLRRQPMTVSSGGAQFPVLLRSLTCHLDETWIVPQQLALGYHRGDLIFKLGLEDEILQLFTSTENFGPLNYRSGHRPSDGGDLEDLSLISGKSGPAIYRGECELIWSTWRARSPNGAGDEFRARIYLTAGIREWWTEAEESGIGGPDVCLMCGCTATGIRKSGRILFDVVAITTVGNNNPYIATPSIAL
ncbi:hypothetical protein DFH09DRAFT_1451334 [Mycena vulgaris]|nr:hypothetical protein DFH09DRAFT_1451334 [Mycena vulgaris]